MLAGAAAGTPLGRAVAACGNGGGGASASPTMRRLARGSPPLGADPRLPTCDAFLTDKRQWRRRTAKEILSKTNIISPPVERGPETGTVALTVNGQARVLRIEPRVSLLDALR